MLQKFPQWCNIFTRGKIFPLGKALGPVWGILGTFWKGIYIVWKDWILLCAYHAVCSVILPEELGQEFNELKAEFVTVYLSIYLFIYPSIHSNFYLSVYLTVIMFIGVN